MSMYAVETNEGIMFARAVTAEAAFRIVATRVGVENCHSARLATITEQELAHPSNITEQAA